MAMNTHASTHTQGARPRAHPFTAARRSMAPCLRALLVLTVVTVGASTIDFGSGMTNVIIAMLIASIKASLVALFFMHLRWDKPINAIIFC